MKVLSYGWIPRSSVISVLVSLLLAVVVVAHAPPSALASSTRTGDFAGPGVDVRGVDRFPGRSGVSRAPNSVSVASTGPVFVYRTVPACAGNGPEVAASVDTLCTGAFTGCPPEQVRAWRFRSAAADVPRVWTRTATLCVAAAQITAGAVPAEVVGLTAEDLRRLPLPAAVQGVQPPGGRVLVGVDVNVYAGAGEVVLPTVVLGQAVSVRARPVGFSWTFGDGASTGVVSDPGAPYPALVHVHAYTSPGRYEIGLSTVYEGEFSVGDGAWIPIEGTAQVASDPVTVQALTARGDLVADDLT